MTATITPIDEARIRGRAKTGAELRGSLGESALELIALRNRMERCAARIKRIATPEVTRCMLQELLEQYQ